MDHNTSHALCTLTLFFNDEAHRLRWLEQMGAFEGPSGIFVHQVHDQIALVRDIDIRVDSTGMARFFEREGQELPSELVSFPFKASVDAGASWRTITTDLDSDLIPDFADVPYRAIGEEE